MSGIAINGQTQPMRGTPPVLTLKPGQPTLVTLTGFSPDNPLRQMGDLSLWLDSRLYNVVESVHQIWLLMVCDLLAAANQPSAGGSSEPTA